MFDLTTNYFKVFGLQPATQVDLQDLKSIYLELQREFHPDKFATATDNIQRQAVQKVSYINQAYDTLRSPLKRAIYLLQQSGHDYDPNVQIHDDPDFLMQQMELREQLSEITNSEGLISALEVFRQQAQLNFDKYYHKFSELYAQKSWSAAGAEINKMMFADKLLAEIDEKEEVLFD